MQVCTRAMINYIHISIAARPNGAMHERRAQGGVRRKVGGGAPFGRPTRLGPGSSSPFVEPGSQGATTATSRAWAYTMGGAVDEPTSPLIVRGVPSELCTEEEERREGDEKERRRRWLLSWLATLIR
eukprot:SAG11_NODE_1494_length_4803_cov_1.551233_6_plen_127_part_00